MLLLLLLVLLGLYGLRMHLCHVTCLDVLHLRGSEVDRLGLPLPLCVSLRLSLQHV